MTGFEFLVQWERAVRGLAAKSCRGRYGLMEELWDEAVDRVPHIVEELYDESAGPLYPYVMANLRWYFFKRMNRMLRGYIEPLPEEELADHRDDCGTYISEEWVQYIMSDLDEDEIELLDLRLFQGKSFETISRRLGVLRPTVYKRYNKIIERLRRALCHDTQ